MSLSSISYRYRIPLSLVATVLFTVSVVGAVIVWHTYHNVRSELVENGKRHGFALAAALQPAMLHDDIWMAFSILRGTHEAENKRIAIYVMLDSVGEIFASSDPRLFPVATLLQEVDILLADTVVALSRSRRGGFTAELDLLPEYLLLITPISSDDEEVGELLTLYSRDVLWPRFAGILEQGGLSVLLVLIIIIPVGWYWGWRLVEPLVNLADCMVRAKNEELEQVKCTVITGDNEIGRLNRHFQELLIGLQEKAELERKMIASERLAAVGQLAAGVAHEINNPLGGMLVAIDTLYQRGVMEPHTERTLSLLERGLKQIQDTTSALLLESRLESHPLTAQDVDDTRTLVMSHANKLDVTIEWSNHITGSVSLPSTLVRQIIINLLLNAVQSASKGGKVDALFLLEPEQLSISITNDGESIASEFQKHLFEPYFSTREEGSGLGLWVTYQIVRQLHGDISVDSENNNTCFTVVLPLREKELSYAA